MSNQIVFLDLETTGLDPQKDKILEVAAACWPGVESGFERVIHQTIAITDMDKVVRRMHGDLIFKVRVSSYAFSDVYTDLLGWLDGIPADTLTLAGNSIHFDRAFLKTQMPRVSEMFHYRMLDVSSLHLAADALGRPRAPKPDKIAHRAMEDVLDSIRQFEFYR